MPYTPQTWADTAAGGTPLTAARMNHIESGIEDAADAADDALAAISPAPTTLTSASSISWNVDSAPQSSAVIDTLQHNATVTLSNLPNGGNGDVTVVQDGTGGRSLALAHAGLTVKTKGAIDTTAGAISLVSFVRRGTRLLVTAAGPYA